MTPCSQSGEGVNKIDSEEREIHVALCYRMQLADCMLITQHFDFFSVYDSSAKLGSSLLNGNMVHLGDFKQCVSVQRSPEHLGGGPTITGRYCNVAVYMEPTGPTSKWRELHSLLDAMKSHEAMSNKHQNVLNFYIFVSPIILNWSSQNDLHLPTFSPLQVGICIPDSCTHLDLEESIVELLRPINHTSGIDFRVRLDALKCQNAHENPIDSWTFIT